jgi:signal transduction histidine kinase
MTTDPGARPQFRILLIEDSEDDAELIGFSLRDAPFAAAIERVETEEDFVERLDRAVPDTILCDYHLPRFDMRRALRIVREERGLDVPFIVVSRLIGEDAAVEAMRQGADDYLLKGRLGRLQLAMQAAIERVSLRRQRHAAEAALRRADLLNRSLLDSLPMQVALLDAAGCILAANRAWDEARRLRRGAPSAVGTNFLEFVDSRGPEVGALASDVRHGIEAVIERREASFAVEYPAPGERSRWLALRAAPLADGENGAVVSIEDITPRMLSHLALHDANRRLRELSHRILAVQEEERRAIALELHDDFGQSLAALKIALFGVRERAASADAERAGQCIAIADDLLERIRALAYSLRPPQLEEFGLEIALRELARRQASLAGLAIDCRVRLEAAPLPAPVEGACFRIVQEAINNATRHAKASRIAVDVEAGDRLLQVVVRDDGAGFDMEQGQPGRAGGLGLAGMAERAELAGGRLKIRSRKGLGTRVSAVFPLDAAAGPVPPAEEEDA